MKETPIIFSGAMVRAILDGKKTQTRRVITPQPAGGVRLSPFVASGIEDGHGRELRCKYGAVEDRLWVRETWAKRDDLEDGTPAALHYLHYRASYQSGDLSNEWHYYGNWRPSIFMPRWASRITLEITDVRVQRIQDINEEDAEAEGVECFDPENDAPVCRIPGLTDWDYDNARQAYAHLWNTINAKRGYPWDSNPWVWALTFKRVQP